MVQTWELNPIVGAKGVGVQRGVIMIHVRSWRALACAAALASLLSFAALGAFVRGGAPGAAAAGDCTTDPSLDAEEQTFLTLINNYRVQNNLAPLTASKTLSAASQWKSTDMGVNNYFAHDDLTRTWVQRVRDCGYGYNTYIGENLAAGNSSAQATFDQWRNSAGHNANMLGANYTAIGIGRAYVPGSAYSYYWTTEFGGVSDGWPSGSPAPTATQPPAATATRTPTATPTRTATATATQPAATATSTTVPPTASPTAVLPPGTAAVHVSDLDAVTAISGSTWNARVTMTVRDAAEQPVAGATVTGTWNGNIFRSCVTDGGGTCTLVSPVLYLNRRWYTFVVSNLSGSGMAYDAGANHDPDGGSSGTRITIVR